MIGTKNQHIIEPPGQSCLIFQNNMCYRVFKEMSTKTLTLLNRFSTKFDDKGATQSMEGKGWHILTTISNVIGWHL